MELVYSMSDILNILSRSKYIFGLLDFCPIKKKKTDNLIRFACADLGSAGQSSPANGMGWTDQQVTRPGKLTVKSVENGNRKFVDFPTNSMVIFHSYVNVYQRLPTSSLDIKKMTKNTSQVHQKRGERPQKFIRSTGQPWSNWSHWAWWFRSNLRLSRQAFKVACQKT